MIDRVSAPAAERNGAPILEALRHEFQGCRRVLEIGSGTGQHAVQFAAALPQLQWQTSDLVENLGTIRAWVEASGLSNVLPPLALDVRDARLPQGSYDAVFSCNTAHIMSLESVSRMFELVGSVLSPSGLMCLYGPFRYGGVFNSPSNERFDANLRQGGSPMGIRDLEALDEYALQQAMRRSGWYAMPANNLLVVWQKTGEEPS